MASWRVDDWLENLGLGSYLNDFIDNGYENRDLCANLKPEELDVIGVKEEKHRTLLLEQAKLLLESNGAESNAEPTPQNYTEPWAENAAYSEPWQKSTNDKKTNKTSSLKGAQQTSETAHAKKKGHATLPASIAKHQRAVQAEQLPHFAGSTGELTMLQLKLKLKDVLQKDRIILSDMSKEGELNQSALQVLAKNYGEKFAIDTERVFEALKELWELSVNLSAGTFPAQQKSKTLPSNTSSSASSDYQEPFKAPVKNNSICKEDTHGTLLTTETTIINKGSLSPKVRPLSVRLPDSKSSEPVYEEIDLEGQSSTSSSKSYPHGGLPSRAHFRSTTTHSSSSVTDEAAGHKKAKPPTILLPEGHPEESEDVFSPEPSCRNTSEGSGNEVTRDTGAASNEKDSSNSGGFVFKLFRKITTKHTSTKSLSTASGNAKLPSSISMPVIADTKVNKKTTDNLSSEYSEVFDKVAANSTSATAQNSQTGASGSPSMAAVHKLTTHISSSEAGALGSRDQSSSAPKNSMASASTVGSSSPKTGTSKPNSTSANRSPRVSSTSMDHSPREGSVDSMAETCLLPHNCNKPPPIAPKPYPRQSRKASPSDKSGSSETPPLKPKRSVRQGGSPCLQTREVRPQSSIDSMLGLGSNEHIVEPKVMTKSLPTATEKHWDDGPAKPRPPQPKPRIHISKSPTGSQQEEKDKEDCQLP